MLQQAARGSQQQLGAARTGMYALNKHAAMRKCELLACYATSQSRGCPLRSIRSIQHDGRAPGMSITWNVPSFLARITTSKQ